MWKCLILFQIIVICGKCWFFLLFEENGGWSVLRAPKSFWRCRSKWNNVPGLVPSLQRQWFRCWRPTAWRKAKNLRKPWIGGIVRWGSVPNARRAYFSIRSYPPSHFQAIACVRNDSKTRNLSSSWFEAKEKRKGFFHRIVTGSRCEGYAVYLVVPAGTDRCYILRAVETERTHHWWTVSNTIDAYEPSTSRKTAIIPAEAWKSDSTAWQRSASRCQTR